MDRLRQSTAKLRTVLASTADDVLREDMLFAIQRLWQFTTDGDSAKREYAMVYHKLKDQGNRHFYKQAWDKYFFDFEPWLRINTLGVDFLGRGAKFYPNTNSDKWVVNTKMTGMEAIATVFEDAANANPPYLRDLVAQHKDPFYYLGKLWTVIQDPKYKQQYVLNEVS